MPSCEIHPNNIGPYWSKALNHKQMNGPTIKPRGPFLAWSHGFLRDRIVAFTVEGGDGDSISKRNPKG
jgi:hypothetical protein